MGKNFVGRVDKAAPGVHDDTTCVRILTESDIILCHDQLSNAIVSMSLSASCACNLRPETWRQWLPSWLSKRLMFAPSPGTCWPNLHTSSRGTLSAHSAVILTECDIVSLFCLVSYAMTNKSLTEVFLRYSLSQMETFCTKSGEGQPVLTRTSRPWTRVSGRAIGEGTAHCNA